jgi:hypothetical protein
MLYYGIAFAIIPNNQKEDREVKTNELSTMVFIAVDTCNKHIEPQRE